MASSSHIKKIVLTGGPCAGKSTIAEVLGKAFGSQVSLIPEAASLLFRGGFPRWIEPASQGAVQRAIYHVQCEMESAYLAHLPLTKAFILDRGTVDGAAYWPTGPSGYFKSVGTSLETELARYDRVIFLESAGEQAYALNHLRNPNRLETWEQAQALDEATRQLWMKHPRFDLIRNQTSFSNKIAAALRIVEAELT